LQGFLDAKESPMTTLLEQRTAAVAAFHERCPHLDAERVVASLSDGLKLLCDLFFARVGHDVEEQGQMDSMLLPAGAMAELRTALRVHVLIDVYSCVEAADEATDEAVSNSDSWLEPLLLQLRLGNSNEPAVREFFDMLNLPEEDQRRRVFASALERRMPQATKAPLVLYRLYPLAVRIVMAVALGDHWRARQLRGEQIKVLPFIADCHACHGQPLDNGETCSRCGNPLWKVEWLSAAD
jgi:hypothetical protein